MKKNATVVVRIKTQQKQNVPAIAKTIVHVKKVKKSYFSTQAAIMKNATASVNNLKNYSTVFDIKSTFRSAFYAIIT